MLNRRQLIPMHPLTIEDILSQETREKIESYEQLGYYFIAFRALDETYFKYSDGSATLSPSSSSNGSKISSREGLSSNDGSDDTKVGSSPTLGLNEDRTANGKTGKASPEIEEKSLASSTDANSDKTRKRKGLVEIVEGHKEGVEGAGVGAVNVYLVVFGDGIISVGASAIRNLTFEHRLTIVCLLFSSISRISRSIRIALKSASIILELRKTFLPVSLCRFSRLVGCCLHSYRHLDWIAYGLMDSIVDTFFPIIDFIEAEADDIDAFLANPLRVENDSPLPPTVSMSRTGRYMSAIRKRLYSIKPVWLHVHTPQVVQFFGVIKDTAIVTQREADFSKLGQTKAKKATKGAPKTLSHKALRGVNEDLYDRGKMLTRIAVSRKLVMGLSRLLIPKSDVVRGLRKRLRDEKSKLGTNEPGQRHDIGIYLGDLQGRFSRIRNRSSVRACFSDLFHADHIITMQQTLTFFDTMLSHNHPAYLGVLRLAYEAAKIGNDKAIVRLNIILVMFLPVNIYCGT